MNGFQDILRSILCAVSTEILNHIPLDEWDVVLEDELCWLDGHVVVIPTLLP